MLEVVSSIDDRRHAGAKAPLKPEHELGATDAAAQSDDFGTATHRNRSLALLRIEAQGQRHHQGFEGSRGLIRGIHLPLTSYGRSTCRSELPSQEDQPAA